MSYCSKEQKYLYNIKAITDAYYNGNLTITTGKNDFDTDNHIYDISVIMGMINNQVYEGLGLDIPKVNKSMEGVNFK